MIRINLLPERAAQKKESIRQQLSIAVLSIVLLFIILGGLYWKVSSKRFYVKKEIQSAEDKLSKIKQKIGELAKIKEQKKKVEEKLKIVRELEAGKKGPLKMFEEISKAIPDMAWIETLNGGNGTVVLSGFAATEDVVADFMRGLEAFPDLGDVELEVARKTKKGDYNLVAFTIRLIKRVKDV